MPVPILHCQPSQRGRGRGDRGAAAVEFALFAPLLPLLLVGIFSYASC